MVEDPAVPAPPSAPQNPATLQDAPPYLPAIAAQLASLYAARDPLAQSLAILDGEIKRVETQAHQSMATQDVRVFTTGSGVLTLKPKTVYVTNDWDALYLHITTTQEFDLLHRRVSITALNQRDPAALPPGVAKTQFDEFKFTPAKGK